MLGADEIAERGSELREFVYNELFLGMIIQACSAPAGEGRRFYSSLEGQ